MKKEFRASDHEIVAYHEWPSANSAAVIQIFHGYGENSRYYEEFAEEANRRGYTAVVLEYRDHGDSVVPYHEENIFVQNVSDAVRLNCIIKEQYPNQKVILLGHSLGTTLGQTALQQKPDGWDGAILIGISSFQDDGEELDKLLAAIDEEIAEHGETAANQFIANNVFARLNDPFSEESSIMAVMTKDQERQRYFESLPTTGAAFSNRFYKDFYLFARKHLSGSIHNLTNHQYPILLLVGDEDVIAENGAAAKQEEHSLLQAGFTNVTLKVYSGYRHSILQEIGRNKVFEDIFQWIEKMN